VWGRAHDHRRPITGISLERFENENEFFRKHENNLISELSLCLSEKDEMQFNHLIAIHAVGFLKRIDRRALSENRGWLLWTQKRPLRWGGPGALISGGFDFKCRCSSALMSASEGGLSIYS
jgi:hypothetical protein